MAELSFGKNGIPCVIGVNNQGCHSIVQNYLLSDSTKNIEVKFNLVKDKVRDKYIGLHYFPTGDMGADVLTKVLSKRKHCANRRLLGMILVQ